MDPVLIEEPDCKHLPVPYAFPLAIVFVQNDLKTTPWPDIDREVEERSVPRRCSTEIRSGKDEKDRAISSLL